MNEDEDYYQDEDEVCFFVMSDREANDRDGRRIVIRGVLQKDLEVGGQARR